MVRKDAEKQRIVLDSPTSMPNASTFLWNKQMLLHVNCRGYVVSQYMNPEPEKYAHAPNMEAKSFMQPEQPFYNHHPGRFFYLKDEESGEFFSSPFKPASVNPDEFSFSAGLSDVMWDISNLGIRVSTQLVIPVEETVELWSLSITNETDTKREISVYPYFPVGYMSWMNQGAEFVEDIQTIVCSSVTAYQKLEDYFANKELKDLTFFSADRAPESWETRQEIFEGSEGLHRPAGLTRDTLENGRAAYQTPACVMRFPIVLEAGETDSFRFVFGPAKDRDEVQSLRTQFLPENAFESAAIEANEYVSQSLGNLRIETPDAELDRFVNVWLPRQIYYHGDINRMTTDPQTRNYLQDAMGMSYLNSEVARGAFLQALSQQKENG